MNKNHETAGVPAESFLRQPQVLARVPVSKSTLWRWVREGRFPKPVTLGVATSAWRASEVAEWIAQRAAEVKP